MDPLYGIENEKELNKKIEDLEQKKFDDELEITHYFKKPG